MSENGAMRFSYCMLPDYPLRDSIEMIQTADRLGFHAVYSVDETWHKDWAVLFAAAADKTQRIRFGPFATGFIFPTTAPPYISRETPLASCRRRRVNMSTRSSLTGRTSPSRGTCTQRIHGSLTTNF